LVGAYIPDAGDLVWLDFDPRLDVSRPGGVPDHLFTGCKSTAVNYFEGLVFISSFRLNNLVYFASVETTDFNDMIISFVFTPLSFCAKRSTKLKAD